MSAAARNAFARLGLRSRGERAEPLVARERLAAARKIAVLRVPRTYLHQQPLVSSFVISNS
jgi:hypothetical protein